MTEYIPITLFTQSEFEKFAGDSSGRYDTRTCISHAAANKEEVDDILAKAKNAGGTLLGTPKEFEWGYFGYFKDLDGHLWEVMYLLE